VSEIREHGGLMALGYINRVIFLMLYFSSIIGIFADLSNVSVANRLSHALIGITLLILGVIAFILTFIRDIYQYVQDKKR
jgi:hypothetical protein